MSDDKSELDHLRDDVEAYREQIIKPRLSDIEERQDALEAENEELRETVDHLQARVGQLDTQLENLIGVDDAELSTHDKRVRDVRAAMIRRAEAKAERYSDMGEGKIALYCREIQNLLADHGHGEIYDTQARRIMDDIENVDGFSFGEKTSPTSGRQVKALRLDIELLPTYAGTNNVVSSAEEGVGDIEGKTTAEDKQG